MRYKLIKTYPGSPRINTEVVWSICLGVYSSDVLGIQSYDAIVVENNPEFWEEVMDNNPMRLEIGKTYIFNYKHCPRDPFKATITRITKDGFPWMEKPNGNGIVTDSYELIEEVIEKDYEIIKVHYNNPRVGQI